MSIDDLLRKGRREEQADLTVLNARVLHALQQEEGAPEKIFTQIWSWMLQSPMLALTSATMLVLIPLHGILSAWGMAEPVYGYMLERLIR